MFLYLRAAYCLGEVPQCFLNAAQKALSDVMSVSGTGSVTPRTVRFHRYGEASEVLQLEEAQLPAPAAQRVRAKVKACGLNPADWALCRGLFAGNLPRGIGLEIAGTVDAVGEGVPDVAPGESRSRSVKGKRRTASLFCCPDVNSAKLCDDLRGFGNDGGSNPLQGRRRRVSALRWAMFSLSCWEMESCSRKRRLPLRVR